MSAGRPQVRTLREMQILGVEKARIPANTPDYIDGRVAEFSNLEAVGKSIFDYYEGMLHNNGTLSEADGLAFNLLCKKYDDWYKAAKKCQEAGMYIEVKNLNGDIINVKLSPWANMEILYSNQLLNLCKEFGLTPVSRRNVEKILKKEKSIFDGLT